MSELTASLLAAFAALVAIAALRAARVKVAGRAAAMVGCALLFASVVLGLPLLSEHEAPQPLSGAIGVLTPPPSLPGLGRGFAVALATRVDSCDRPVTVTLVAAGTSEYWSDYRARTSVTTKEAFPFVLVLPADITGNLQVGLASTATAITAPLDARFGHASEIQIISVVQAGARTIVTGRVTDWPSTLRPLLATFHANWLAPRGLSTCYLRLPPLSGSRTAKAVVDAVGGCGPINAAYRDRPCTPTFATAATPYVGALLLSHGTSIVTARSGEVSSDKSVPPPTSVLDGDKAWACGGRPNTTGSFPSQLGRSVPDVVRGRDGGGAYSVNAIAGTAGDTCRAVAVITENSASYTRDLVILLIGAVMGLGLTLVVQTIIDTFAGGGGTPAEGSRGEEPAPIQPT